MKTIIFDIDGTLTDIWPIEKSVLLCMTDGRYEKEIDELKKSGISNTHIIFLKVSKRKISKRKYFTMYNNIFIKILKMKDLPILKIYPLVNWIKSNGDKYIFVYATGGQKLETEFVLTQLGIIKYFDLENSINRNNCRFSKKTGIPFKKIRQKYSNCTLITDSESDRLGAIFAKIPVVLVKPKQNIDLSMI